MVLYYTLLTIQYDEYFSMACAIFVNSTKENDRITILAKIAIVVRIKYSIL